MKDRADALRLASVWVKVEMAALLGVRQFVSKPRPEIEPMHDYRGNGTGQQGPFCAFYRRDTSLWVGPRVTLFQSRVARGE